MSCDITWVVLSRQMSNPAPPLLRAVQAYRGLEPLHKDLDHFTAKPRSRTVRLLRKHDVQALVEGYLGGETQRQLAARFGVHRHTVRDHLRAAGVEARLKPMTAAQIETATRLYADGLSVKAIGAELGIHGATVNNVLRRHGVAMRNPWDHPQQRGLDAPWRGR
jgi:DNA-binding CsgD family transcriptional regulator